MTAFVWMKRFCLICLLAYSGVTTILLIKLDPKPLVIGIDPYGTRVVTGEKDPILKAERDAFIKRFIIYLYNFDETNFDERISLMGDSMSLDLWERKKSEYLSISTRLKAEPLSQKGRILDLRQVDDFHYEADLEVHIQSRLRENDLKVRVSLDLSSAHRTNTRPYPWEIKQYDEQISN
jgi:hypothetical protein